MWRCKDLLRHQHDGGVVGTVDAAIIGRLTMRSTASSVVLMAVMKEEWSKACCVERALSRQASRSGSCQRCCTIRQARQRSNLFVAVVNNAVVDRFSSFPCFLCTISLV
jgi:hypothetical protein